jgi:predicted kinase
MAGSRRLEKAVRKMSEAAKGRLPGLIVVTGAPGVGKSTLARSLAQALRCPVVSRDEIKEGLITTSGVVGVSLQPDTDIQGEASELFFDTLGLWVGRGVTVIAEAAFQHSVWAPRLKTLMDLARVRLILCDVKPGTARSRVAARMANDPLWSQFHPGEATIRYDPPRLESPTLRVDTTEGYQPSLETIVKFART